MGDVQPVVTPEEMAAIDAAAPVPVEVLIERAGRAVARAALDMMGGAYGARVVVIAGKGNNGNDGRAAARALRRRGCLVTVCDAKAPDLGRHRPDLIIDAAYGTGFRGTWEPPDHDGVPVLAVDIPSGVDGLTGRAEGAVMRAARTVVLVAVKPGLVLLPGRELAGEQVVVDIGLPVARAATFLVESADVARWIPSRRPDDHKWRAAVWIAAGSPGMTGAARLCALAAQRTGAGMVRLGVPDVDPSSVTPIEVVGRALPAAGWAPAVLADLDRFHALVVGPGLGRSDATCEAVRRVVASAPVPVVVDGDGLVALAWSSQGPGAVLRSRSQATVLTPHDGEFAVLRGARLGADRIDAVRRLARDLHCVVLLKGPTTIVADERGRVLLVTAGDSRLATAGTGDVLSGIIGALISRGVAAFEAAACGAWLHGRAGVAGPQTGLIASDLPDLIPTALAELAGLAGLAGLAR